MEERYKQDLKCNDKSMQIQTIIHLNCKLLDMKDQQVRRKFAEDLVEKGIALIISKFIKSDDKKLVRSTLFALQSISECHAFYTTGIAKRSFTNIIEKSNNALNSDDEDKHRILHPICNTLSSFLNRALSFGIHIDTFGDVHSLLHFLNDLCIDEIPYKKHTLSAMNLYIATLSQMKKLEMDTEFMQTFTQVQEVILNTANEHLKQCIQDSDLESKQHFIRIIVAICNIQSRLFDGDYRKILDEQSTSETPVFLSSDDVESIFKKLEMTLLDVVIPNSIDTDLLQISDSHSSLYFINVLYRLHQRHDIDFSKYSQQLSKYGYLMYFYKMLSESKINRESTCSIIARILRDMSQIHFTMTLWSTGLDGFEQFIKNYFLTSELDRSVSTLHNSFCSDAEFFLIFIHLVTDITYDIYDFVKIITKINVSEKIKSITVDDHPEIPTLQVILSLFFISIFSKPIENIDEMFPNTLPRAFGILRKAGAQHYYTQYKTLPLLIFEGTGIHYKVLKNEIKLWIKFEDKFYLLLRPGSSWTLVDSFFHINVKHERRAYYCPWKCRDLLNSHVDSELSLDEQLKQAFWGNFPNILFSYTIDREISIVSYLKMINVAESVNLLKISLIFDCANAIIEFYIKPDFVEKSMDLKLTLTKLFTHLIKESKVRNDSSVIQAIVNNNEILEELGKQAFTKNQNALAAASFECFRVLWQTQYDLTVPCPQPFIINSMMMYIPLYPRDSENNNYYDVLCFYDKMWTMIVNRPILAVQLQLDNDPIRILQGIYQMYCVIHINSRESQWYYMFPCMENFLKYIYKYNKTALCLCCEYIGNIESISIAIKSNYYQKQFINFLHTWLKRSIKSRTPSVRRALLSLDDRRSMKENIFHLSPFLKVIYLLEDFVNESVDLKFLMPRDVMKLKKQEVHSEVTVLRCNLNEDLDENFFRIKKL